MKRIFVILLNFAILPNLAFSLVQFTQAPTLTQISGKWWVNFEVSENTDVAVSVIDPRDSTAIRHLAGGMLGSNAPAPLMKSSLSQHIEWDGKDDLGFTVTNPGTMTVRVRAGMALNLEQWVGEDLYSFNAGPGSRGDGVYGMVTDPSDQSMYICGNPGSLSHAHWSVDYRSIRQYDKDGNYLKTIYPIPAKLPYADAAGWGVLPYPAGSYTPVHICTSIPGFTNTLLATIKCESRFLMYLDGQGKLMFGAADQVTKFGRDGSKPAAGVSEPFVTNSELPKFGDMRPVHHCVTLLPGGKEALLSQVAQYTAATGFSPTAFFRGSRVYKVNLATGAAAVWLDLDTMTVANDAARKALLQGGVNYLEIHGTAVDAQGRVYVCNRLRREIGVYDSTGTKLGRMPLDAPDLIAVSSRTGAVYATARCEIDAGAGYIKLVKFNPFDNGGAAACTLTVSSKLATGSAAPPPAYVSLTESGSTTRVWVGYTLTSVRIYQDQGGPLTLYKDFANPAANRAHGFDRLCVDRRTETVYFNDSWITLWKIENWANPVAVRCSTSANKPLNASDLNISPLNMLFVRSGDMYYGPFSRYTLNHKHAPINFTNTNTNNLTTKVQSRFGGCVGDKGLAVRPDGVAAVIQRGTTGMVLSYYVDSGSTVQSYGDVKAQIGTNRVGGLEFDLKGNMYFGACIPNAGLQTPTPFVGNDAYGRSVGSIVKYAAGFDTDTVGVTTTGITGPQPERTYSAGFAPFSAEPSSGNCVCRSPRFDVDPYGRLFVPNATTCNVTILDNADNTILKFGRYGNNDERGGGGDIPLAWVTSAAASEDYVYLTDYANCRIARIKMNYALDNHPEIRVARAETEAGPAMSDAVVQPNPFNPSCGISLSFSTASRVRMDIFDAAGRFIRTLASDFLAPGQYHFQWNGTDRANRSVAAGVYYLRVTAGQAEQFKRLVLAR